MSTTVDEEGENETFGPKVGIKVSKSQAELIIKRHFPHLSLTNISHINRGYNNRVYNLSASDGREYILRLSGRFWTRYKTENEVAALVYIKKLCKSIPVPKILGYCTDKEKSGVNAEYILMEKLEGEPLECIWSDLDSDKKLDMITQVADIVSKIQSLSFSSIGSFQLERESSKSSPKLCINPEAEINDPEKYVTVGKGVEYDGGPFENYLDYFRSTCKTEIHNLKNCSFMTQAEGYAERLKRIENFVGAFENIKSLPVGIPREAVEAVPFVFTHGDFEPRNIMVNKDTNTITGILDWEFAGSYPIDEEWFTGFAFLDCDTTDWRTFNEQRPTMASNEEHPFDSEMIKLLREDFFTKLRKNGAIIPDDISGHMIRAELYYFKGFMCPWWLREKRDPIPDTHFDDRRNACRHVDNILEKYGF